MPFGLIRLDNIDTINKSICVGMDIDTAFRGQGLAKEIYRVLMQLLFDQGFNRIWLLVLDFNIRAINLYLKLGFKLEGSQRKAIFRNNSYHDYLMMSILKDEYV